QRLQSQGLSVQQYFQFTGMDTNKFLESLKPQALKTIQSRLVLEAVAKAEKITASDEELDKEIEEMASTYQMEIDKLKELIGDKEKEHIREDLVVQKAVDFVAEHANEVDK
ncbi:MAG TPA: trigger factor, partial [Lachnospiraceae bacterium]|nr:trigger factor [Lachnospiraceae bacterium]